MERKIWFVDEKILLWRDFRQRPVGLSLSHVDGAEHIMSVPISLDCCPIFL